MTDTGIDAIDIESVDLTDPAVFRDGPPHELFSRMRAQCPVRWNPTASGPGFWSVTRDAEVGAVSRDFELFSSYRAGVFLNPDQIMPLEVMRTNILYKDPPEHTKYRKIVQSVFSARALRELEPGIRRRAVEIICALAPVGSCDFVTDIAVPFPLAVLADLMGLPQDDTPRLRAWTDAMEQAQRSPESAAAAATFTEMAGYLAEQVGAQLATDVDTLVKRLRDAKVDGESLDDHEILTFFGLLVFAGNDTTRNTASSGVLTLLQHPEQWRMLCDDAALIPGAVEEVLRHTSVVQYFARTATRDTELAGQRIREGQKVVTWFGSASRDEDLIHDPQRFDIARRNQDHRAFGGGGRHFCLGAGLARLELRILFEELTTRLPDLQVAGPIRRLPSVWANSLTTLPLRFTPVEQPTATPTP